VNHQIELIALGAKVRNVWAPYDVVNGIYRSVAIAVANGNADIVEANLRACRAWDWQVALSDDMFRK
jgi:hypothetical protein